MKYYLTDILPRIKKHSTTLDQTAFLVDKPWVVCEQDGGFQKIIFRRDGRVHLSNDGNVTDGTWEYLPEAQSMLIDYGNGVKKLYRHQFMDDAVLALKIDGRLSTNESDYFLLANEQIVDKLDVRKYLEDKYINFDEINIKPKPFSQISSNETKKVGKAKSTDGKELIDNFNNGYKKRTELFLFGLVSFSLLVVLYILNFANVLIIDEEYTALAIFFSIIFRIFSAIVVSNVAEEQNRNELGWLLFGLIMPAIALMAIGLTDRKSVATQKIALSRHCSSDLEISYEKFINLMDNQILQVVKNLGYLGETEVHINEKPALDGFYRSSDGEIVYEVVDGKIKMEYFIESFKQKNRSILEVGASRIDGFCNDSPVWLNGVPAPDGKYSMGFFRTATVSNGRLTGR